MARKATLRGTAANVAAVQTDWSLYCKAGSVDPKWTDLRPPFSAKPLNAAWDKLVAAQQAVKDAQAAFEVVAAEHIAKLPAGHPLHCPHDGTVIFGWRFSSKVGVAFVPTETLVDAPAKVAAKPRLTL